MEKHIQYFYVKFILAVSLLIFGFRSTLKVISYQSSFGSERTTMVVVPILAAAGLKVPKTSSRAITSPSGTADTMEVLAPVKLSIKKLNSIVRKVGAFIAWGGGIQLASADDKLIQVRHAMSIDPEGMLLASILAKKKAVDSNRVLIDIPVGKHTKVKTRSDAEHLKREFIRIGSKLKMRIEVVVTDGRQPIGNGIGPVLEAKDVLYILQRDPRAPKDLEKKSLDMAAQILKMAGRKHPKRTAKEMLTSGKAYKKFQEIIKAQGGNEKIQPDDLPVADFKQTMIAYKSGVLVDINSASMARVARLAGAPLDKAAGIYLHHHEGAEVQKGEPIATVYAESKEKLQFALETCCIDGCYIIK